MKLPKITFKIFFSQILVGGPSSAMIVVRWKARALKLSGKANWDLSDDQYYTEFVSWCGDNFFRYGGRVDGWGLDLYGKFHSFFNPSLIRERFEKNIFRNFPYKGVTPLFNLSGK